MDHLSVTTPGKACASLQLSKGRPRADLKHHREEEEERHGLTPPRTISMINFEIRYSP